MTAKYIAVKSVSMLAGDRTCSRSHGNAGGASADERTSASGTWLLQANDRQDMSIQTTTVSDTPAQQRWSLKQPKIALYLLTHSSHGPSSDVVYTPVVVVGARGNEWLPSSGIRAVTSSSAAVGDDDYSLCIDLTTSSRDARDRSPHAVVYSRASVADCAYTMDDTAAMRANSLLAALYIYCTIDGAGQPRVRRKTKPDVSCHLPAESKHGSKSTRAMLPRDTFLEQWRRPVRGGITSIGTFPPFLIDASQARRSIDLQPEGRPGRFM